MYYRDYDDFGPGSSHYPRSRSSRYVTTNSSTVRQVPVDVAEEVPIRREVRRSHHTYVPSGSYLPDVHVRSHRSSSADWARDAPTHGHHASMSSDWASDMPSRGHQSSTSEWYRDVPSRGHHSTSDRPRERERSRGKKDKRFLREVQDELEEQRAEWKDEVDRLMNTSVTSPGSTHNASFSSDHGSASGAVSNSYVDSSSGSPIFKAFVDVKDFPASGISVTVDKVANKVVVTAKKAGHDGRTSRTFTQKVQLPRYADDQMVKSKLGRDGVLTLEVPLIFYFPQEKKSSKSFINQVKTKPDGSKLLEILVNVGQEISPNDLRVRVNSDNELLIMAERSAPVGGVPFSARAKLIKRYILPRNADTRNITSQLGNDGRLVVIVPLFKDSSMLY